MNLLKRLTPEPVYRRWKAWEARRLLDATLAEYARSVAAGPVSDELLQRLVRVWGNAEWSALPEYMQCFIEAARSTPGPILECGSGLSTLLMGLQKAPSQRRLYTLEHHPEWHARMQGELARQRITGVDILHAPLQDYGAFTWYRPAVELPRGFTLVICDGPPSVTPGGRYGLLPVTAAHLAPGCVILLDDAARPDEQAALARWREEYGVTWEMAGNAAPYAIARMPG
jgi:predicted O-methyltransferase YrrM